MQTPDTAPSEPAGSPVFLDVEPDRPEHQPVDAHVGVGCDSDQLVDERRVDAGTAGGGGMGDTVTDGSGSRAGAAGARSARLGTASSEVMRASFPMSTATPTTTTRTAAIAIWGFMASAANESTNLEIHEPGRSTTMWRGASARSRAGATAASAAARIRASSPSGGSGNSIALQPLSVTGQTGLNVAGGVAALSLRAQ